MLNASEERALENSAVTLKRTLASWMTEGTAAEDFFPFSKRRLLSRRRKG